MPFNDGAVGYLAAEPLNGGHTHNAPSIVKPVVQPQRRQHSD